MDSLACLICVDVSELKRCSPSQGRMKHLSANAARALLHEQLPTANGSNEQSQSQLN